MKKIFGLCILLFSLVLVGCTGDKDSTNSVESSIKVPSSQSKNTKINIMSLSDTHGYLETTDIQSLSKISAYMNEYENTVRIAGGDMFQGSGISNLTRGRAMVDIMNAMEFDCMVIGNHEFDWGIDTILSYFDGDEDNGEANFPLLAANVYDEAGNPLANTKPYHVVEVADTKIGIIGIIGDDLESSIDVGSLDKHQFVSSQNVVTTYAQTLRINESCDIVILATHNGSSDNHKYGASGVDLIINAHTHYTEFGTSQHFIPYIQSGANAQYLSHTIFNKRNDIINYDSCKNVKSSYMASDSSEVNNLISKYKTETAAILESKLTTINNFTKTGFINYACQTYETAYGADIAFVNAGGFRTNWNSTQIVTYNDLITMMPFENEMKTVKLKGVHLKKIADLQREEYDIVSSVKLDRDSGGYYIEQPTGEKLKIMDAMIYNVVAISYIFDKDQYPFLSGTDIVSTGTYMRDIIQEDLLKRDVLDLANYIW